MSSGMISLREPDFSGPSVSAVRHTMQGAVSVFGDEIRKIRKTVAVQLQNSGTSGFPESVSEHPDHSVGIFKVSEITANRSRETGNGRSIPGRKWQEHPRTEIPAEGVLGATARGSPW